MKRSIKKKVSVLLNRFLNQTKAGFIQIWGFLGRIIRVKKLRLITILFFLFLLAGYLFIWVLSPDSKSMQAPVVVASCDCDTLPKLAVNIIDKKKLRIDAIFENCNYVDWSRISLQAPDDAENVDIEIEETKQVDVEKVNLASRLHALKDSLRSGSYFTLTKDFLLRHFDTITNSRITLSYITSQGIYRKSFSKYYLSLLFIPASTKKPDQNYPVPIDVLAPQSFLLTSSIPDAYKIFLLENGINYTVSVIPERTGILLNFDDLEAEASREIIILLASTILGFVIGVILEKALVNDN